MTHIDTISIIVRLALLALCGLTLVPVLFGA